MNELHQDLGNYRKQRRDRAQIDTDLAALGEQIRVAMRGLELSCELDDLENRRLATAARLACEEAAKTLKDALQAQSENQSRIEELERRVANRAAERPQQPDADLTALREALVVAARAMEADSELPAIGAAVRELKRQTENLHHRLEGAPADFESTEKLPVPAAATVRRYREEMDSLRREIERVQGRLRETNESAARIAADLARLQRRRELPSEDTLRQARQRRDHGWVLVLADWKGGGAKEEFVPGVPLEKAFPEAIVKADAIADCLRLDAESVAQAEDKRQQLAQAARDEAAAKDELAECKMKLEERQRAWKSDWSQCAIEPRSPLEMEEWLGKWNEFCASLGKLKSAADNFDRKTAQVNLARERLAAVLGDSAEKEFTVLFEAARSRVQHAENASGRCQEIDLQIKRYETEIEGWDRRRTGLAVAVQSALECWKDQCALVGLPEGASPDNGLILLSERRQLLEKFDKWRELSAQSLRLSASISQFENSVFEESRTLEIGAGAAEDRETALWGALSESRQAQTRHDQLVANESDAAEDLERARGRLANATESLEGLLRLAGVRTEEDLERLLAHLERRAEVQTRILSLRNALVGVARGQSVDDFVAAVSVAIPDLNAGEKQVTEKLREEKKQEQEHHAETVFQLRRDKEDLDKAGDQSAALRQEAENCAATLRQHAHRFLRLRLATELLNEQVEEFRKRNQGPLLEKSGEVFRSITRGAFSGLGVNFGESDAPVLVGVRPDRTEVSIPALSDGSRDQLFLALRLAALEQHIGCHEPMPLILDDLLITFDDERAQAILLHLLALAKRTQIFLFSHHQHLVELCQITLGQGEFHLHNLSCGFSDPVPTRAPRVGANGKEDLAGYSY